MWVHVSHTSATELPSWTGMSEGRAGVNFWPSPFHGNPQGWGHLSSTAAVCCAPLPEVNWICAAFVEMVGVRAGWWCQDSSGHHRRMNPSGYPVSMFSATWCPFCQVHRGCAVSYSNLFLGPGLQMGSHLISSTDAGCLGLAPSLPSDDPQATVQILFSGS